MTVLWVRGSGMKEGTIGDRGSRTFRWRGLVKSDTPNEARAAILGALPGYGSPHPEDATCLCVKTDARQRLGAPRYWEADVEWNTLFAENKDPREKQKQPDQRRPDWSYRFVAIQQYVTKDLEGRPFVDRAGSPLSPPPSIPIYVQEITISRFEAFDDPQFNRGYLNCRNSDAWLGARPGEALLQDIRCHQVFEQGAWWFQKTYVVLVSPEKKIPGSDAPAGGFDYTYVLNAGPREVQEDKNGKPVVVPVRDLTMVLGHPALLDYYGRRIDTTKPDWQELVYYLPFRTADTRPFWPLDLVPPR